MGKKKYVFNEDYFEQIGANQAYWLGLLAADGWGVEKTGLVALSCAVKDKEHIDLLRQDVGYPGPLYERVKTSTHEVTLHLRSDKMYNDVSKVFSFVNKSRGLKFPILEESLIPHFVRGFFDGDGWVELYSRGVESRINLGIVGCSPFIVDLHRWFVSNGFGNVMIRDKSGTKSFKFGGRGNSERFFDLLKGDSERAMTRKWDKIRDFNNMGVRRVKK